MSGNAATVRGGVLGRILRARWFPFVAGGVAVVLFAAAAVVGFGRLGSSSATEAAAHFAPSAFPTSLSITSLPVSSRGKTSHVQLQSLDSSTIASEQLYDNGQLYLTVRKPASRKAGNNIETTVTMDFAPLVAGIHVLSARVTDVRGEVSVPAPIQLPVLDSAAAGGNDGRLASYGATPAKSEFVSVQTSAGETLKSLAGRLGTTPGKIMFPIIDGHKPLGTTAYSLTTILPVGITADAGLISAAHFTQLGGYHAPDLVPVAGPTISATTNGCAVSVSVSTNSPTLALYASTPLQPGFLRVGDVSAGHPFVASDLPVGPSTFEAYNAGATSGDTSGPNAPTAPASTTVPASCATNGWTGNAKIVNGILLTDASITTPYAYVSVDAGNWQRVPGDQSQTLTTGTINDIRNYLTLGKYDQLDVQVWGSDGTSSFMQASGEFCRKSLTNADPGDSSGSTTQCRPPGVNPGGAPTVTSSDETLLAESISGQPDNSATPVNDPTIRESVDLTSDTPVNLLVSTVGDFASEVELQFSYFPISQQTTAPDPPGVFFTEQEQLNDSGSVSLQIDPWQWRNAKAIKGDGSTFDASGNNLSLNDQIALALANANLAAGKDLIDTVYVRAVTIQSSLEKIDSQPIPSIASSTVEVDMKDTASYPSISTASAILIPGDDEHATDDATRGECFTITTLPPPNTWLEDPQDGPFQYYKNGGDPANALAGNPQATDLALSIQEWGGVIGSTHCLDPDADAKRAAAAQAQADAAANDCDFWCFVEAAVIGAAVGFALGGPVGALVGVAAGVSIAIADPAGLATLESGLAQLWDIIATEYSTIYGSILDVVAQLNPICAAISTSSSKDADACKNITEDVVAAAVTYFTGLPRQLPDSSTIGDITKGDLQSAIESAVEVGVSAAGFDCSDLTISKDDGDDLAWIADKAGATDASAALAQSQTSDGDYSLCQGLAGVITNTVSSQYSQFDGQIMGEAMEAYFQPGMTVAPLEDTSPTLVVAGSGTTPLPIGSTCPAYVNMTVHLPGDFTYDPATKQSYEGPDVTWTLAPQDLALTADATGRNWSGTMPVPLIPALYSYGADVLSQAPTKPTDPYLAIDVDSPCISKTLSIVATKYYLAAGTPFAFVNDFRPVSYYY
jgi:hypothetical protein